MWKVSGCVEQYKEKTGESCLFPVVNITSESLMYIIKESILPQETTSVLFAVHFHDECYLTENY